MSWDWEALKKQQQAKGNIDLSPKKKKESFDISDSWIVPVSYVLLSIILIIVFWYVARWAHYKYSYEVKMKQEIIEMVKPEALKDKYRKEVPGGS